MKYKIKNNKINGYHIEVPQRESGVFNLPAPAFKIYVWLLSHDIGFEFNRKFLDAGVKMHHITVTKNLKILQKYGAIKNVTSDIEIVTSDIKVNQLKKKVNQKSKNVTNDISSFESKSIVENVTNDISQTLKELERDQVV
jgi:hypothetical protein